MINVNLIPSDDLVCVSSLSSKYVLLYFIENLDKLNLPKFDEELLDYIHIDMKKLNPEIFDETVEDLIGNASIRDFLEQQISHLANKYLVFEKGNIFLKKSFYNSLSTWQNIITRVSPLHILVYFLWKERFDIEFVKKFFENRYTTLPSPYDHKLSQIIKGRLIDLHIHLNGTSESEYVWLLGLKKPELIYETMKTSFEESKIVKKLFLYYDVKPYHILKLLKLSRYIREYLSIKLKEVEFGLELEKEFFRNLNLVRSIDFLPYKFENFLVYRNHPIEIYEGTFKNEITYEAILIYKLFDKIFRNQNTHLEAKILYLYFLIRNFLNNFTNHQIFQYGFTQFNAITRADIRKPIENEDYKTRFLQIKGFYPEEQKIKHVEGRFAPKDDIKKLKNLIKNIMKGYNYNLKYSLGLVAHFIKGKDKRNLQIGYRHYNLRKRLKIQAVNLVKLLENNKKFAKIFKGIDAAGNELDAGPEVFAPVFRYIKRSIEKSDKIEKKKIGITFHAGEHFLDIISGIRYIYEAITFLDMKQGDRIGHGVALGIDPKMFLSRVGRNLYIRKGEFFDNLVFIYTLLQENIYSDKNILNLLVDEIQVLYKELYREKDMVPMSILRDSYICRSLDPHVHVFEKNIQLSTDTLEELNIKKILGFEPDEKSMELYRKYHDSRYIEIYNEVVKIDTVSHRIYKNYVEIVEILQKIMLDLLSKKNIAIEIPITSNVRIGLYREYKEHHIFRWITSGKKPNILLVTDDPGIFNTNIENEFMILMEVLIDEYGLDSRKVEEIIHELIYNSELFKF